MSADELDLQAQVEAILGTLVRAASVELIKLFESRFRASASGPDATQRAGGKGGFEVTDSLSSGGAKRSVGVQVEPDRVAPPVPPHEDCLKDYKEGKQQGPVLRSQVGAALKQQTVVVEEWRLCEADCPAEAKPPAKNALEGACDEASQLRPAAKIKPLVVRLDPCDAASPEKVVCPLILRPESPHVSEKPSEAEPQQACVSTTGGPAHSPAHSPDGSLTPAEAGVWRRVRAPMEKSDLLLKLKLTSLDKKLTRPCRVHLLDMLSVPESERTAQDGDAGGGNSKSHHVKDLRHHRGRHTGRRICCFRPCGDGRWRLKEAAALAAAHQEGHVCGVCGKAFTHRKILRRHRRFHTGEKPYSCPACSKTFALRKSLRRHRRFHTGERPHVCTKCSKSFRLRENLKAHLRSHSGEKPFSCGACGKTFRIVKNLEQHRCQGGFVPSFRVIAGL